MAQNFADYSNEFKYVLGIGFYAGAGAPTFSAKKGSIYVNTSGSTTNDRMYINTDGSTTWTAVTTQA